MKTFTQVSKFIIILFIALFVYGCPVFKSIKYPATALLGDSLTVHVNFDLMGTTGPQNALLEIVLPSGWEFTNKVIEFDGLNNAIATLSPNSENGDGYWSASVSGQVTADNVLFDLELLNTKSTASIDTFQISISGDISFYCEQKFAIRSITDETVPTQFTYHDDTLEWNMPKNNSDTKGYRITDNTNSWFTTNTKVPVDPGSELHRYAISAVDNNDQEYALSDTIFIFHGDSLFVSESGDDGNTGTEISPLKSLPFALNIIDEDYALSKDKSIRLLDGTYLLECGVQLRDRVSLIGNGPQNSIISCTSNGIAINSENLNTGMSIANLSINAQQNEAIFSFSTSFWDVPEITLSHVQLYNTDQTADGLRTLNAKLFLDHIVVAGMDSTGVVGLNIQINNSVFTGNHIALYTFMSDIAWGTVRIVNSIFFDNQKSISSLFSPSEVVNYITINNSIIDTEWLSNGEGNFYSDPLFIDDPNYPYLLDPISPAVDAAIDSLKYNDPALTENSQLAKFPARGTVRGDLGIYGGGGTDPVSGVFSYRVYQDLEIYPNPTDGILTVRWPNNKEPVNLWLTNVNGTKLKLLDRNNQIDLSSYKPGFYFLTAEIDGVYYLSKIIVK
ncbi:T9SS type A sorting domain-containing protein [Mangrovibacterium diazotrophicum]|nr:T9SS type A sorting domain-containing protein [Mangrovibacterium diazotrophicum]